MLESQLSSLINPFSERVIDTLVELKITPEVTMRTGELIREGGVPIAYGNHQGLADALALAKIAEYVKNISLQIPGHPVKGLAVIFAASFSSGHQGEELRRSYELLIGGGRSKGAEPVPVTREKDKVYGMSRDHIISEMLHLSRKLSEGYGIGILPEGSVQGGRPKVGAKSIEEINGIIEINNTNLTDLFNLIDRRLRRKGRFPYFQPFGLHGSFKIMQSPEVESPKPKYTTEGIQALIFAAFGISTGLKIEARSLMPYTEKNIVSDLGSRWREDPQTFNRYAMKRILPGIPLQAWGIYGKAN